MEDSRRIELRNSFLDHLVIFARTRCQDSSFFGTLADSWYAYHRGGIFVKGSENPRTLNNPTGRLDLEAMRQLPFISQNAGAVLFEGHRGRLVKEHTVPRAHLCKMVVRDRSKLDTRERMQVYLERYYHVAALTKSEHDDMYQHSESMPSGWDEIDCLARYVHITRYSPPT